MWSFFSHEYMTSSFFFSQGETPQRTLGMSRAPLKCPDSTWCYWKCFFFSCTVHLRSVKEGQQTWLLCVCPKNLERLLFLIAFKDFAEGCVCSHYWMLAVASHGSQLHKREVLKEKPVYLRDRSGYRMQLLFPTGSKSVLIKHITATNMLIMCGFHKNCSFYTRLLNWVRKNLYPFTETNAWCLMHFRFPRINGLTWRLWGAQAITAKPNSSWQELSVPKGLR